MHVLLVYLWLFSFVLSIGIPFLMGACGLDDVKLFHLNILLALQVISASYCIGVALAALLFIF